MTEERPALTAMQLLALFLRDAESCELPDETRLSFGWWEGDHFNARIALTLGGLRGYLGMPLSQPPKGSGDGE